MQYISNLTKEQQRQLALDLRHIAIENAEFVCMIADKYNVDRNETYDLFTHLLTEYGNKQDLIKIGTKRIERKIEIVMKLLQKRG